MSAPICAEHIVGGVISYECLGAGTMPNTKRLQFKVQLMYDCASGSSFDPNIEIGIYRGTSGSYRTFRTINANAIGGPIYFDNTKSCASLLRNICVNAVTYLFVIDDLPEISENFMIAYQRCCRNMTISNIAEPNRTGSTIMLEMTPDAIRSCNSSPQFDQSLPLVNCVSEETFLNLKGNDKENDEVIYELCAPFNGGGTRGMGGSAGSASDCLGISPNPGNCVPTLTEIKFVGNNISALNPFPSDIPISIQNGIFTAKPNTIGQYIMGVCIKEIRNGILLTSQRRDIQVNFVNCNILIKASINANDIINGAPAVVECKNTLLKIKNTSVDSLYIKNVYWELIGAAGKKITDTSFHFSKSIVDTGLYQAKLVLNRGNNCSDSMLFFVYMGATLPLDMVSVDFDGCKSTAVSIQLKPGIENTYDIDFGDGFRDTFQGGSVVRYIYRKADTYRGKVFIKTKQGCEGIFNLMFPLFPLDSINFTLANDDSVWCSPDSIRLRLKVPLPAGYSYKWSLSDGRMFNSSNPSYTVKDGEKYKLKLEISSPAGCKIDSIYAKNFIAKEKPKANFTILNENITLKKPELNVTNSTIKANRYQWNFGDGSLLNEFNPMHTYIKNGRYKVTLYAANENGCLDSLSRFVQVGTVSEYFIPNVFSPNGDGKNDIFLPQFSDALTFFEINIFNRWGDLVFISRDPSVGWDGSNRGEQNAPLGVYIYQIKIKYSEQATKVLKGSVTLIR